MQKKNSDNEKKQRLKRFVQSTLFLSTGSALCAFAVNTVLIPFDFLSSGFTGFSMLIFYKWQAFPIGVTYLMLNIPVLLLSVKLINMRFVLYTAWGMIIYSGMLLVPFSVTFPITDKLLAALVAGGISGLGIAVMLRSYGSAGGSEIICILLYKLTGLRVGNGTIIINAILLGISMFIFPLEDILYTLIFIIVSARVTDTVFHGIAKRRAVMIISDKWNQILGKLKNSNLFRVTLLNGKGGFRGSEKSVLLSVVNSRYVSSLKNLIIKEDPNAFIIVMEASDVTGENVGNQPHW